MTTVLVALSPEVTTKSRRTRQRFQRQLIANIRDALASAGIEARVINQWNRLIVEASDAAALERVAAVFGVASVSEIEARVAPELDEIVRTGEVLYADRVREKKFAVRARRVGRHPFRAQDIAVQLGAALNRYAGVDLEHPDVTVYVEARDREALLYSGKLPGEGGLPLGVEGRAVALISGGFDSPAAAWLMLKRGVALDYVFCNLGGAAYERSVVTVAKVLADHWSYGDRPAIHVVDFERPRAALEQAAHPRYWQVVLKRLMYRAGEAVAREIGAKAIVTGESIGQVSSQTLGNLRAIDEVATLPVLRPLLGMNKTEIIRLAERVGTAGLSARIPEYCGISRHKPVTDARPEAVRDEEARLDLAVLEEAVARRKRLDLRALQAGDLVEPYLFLSEIPESAGVIDCRETPHYRTWHYPGAVRWDASELALHFGKLEKTKPYVLYCSFGVQSAFIAEAMQRAGYEAYSFKGGAAALRRYAAERVPSAMG